MRAFIVGGMALGDEGKGTVTDHLVRKHHAPLVVRYNGGPQAAHSVVTVDGRHHTFSQYGSGTFAGARTFLSRYMLINPYNMINEVAVLAPKLTRSLAPVLVDPDCVIITPYHVEVNRYRERGRGRDRHGSVGEGVGEARGDSLAGLALRVKHLLNPDEAEEIVYRILDAKLTDGVLHHPRDPEAVLNFYLNRWLPTVVVRPWSEVATRYRDRAVVFEGAQGFLLDESYGFAPYNSWTDCTFGNAHKLLIEVAGEGQCVVENVTRVGVVRSYYTRHGAGPFPTQDAEVAVGIEKHNGYHPWMGVFRTGHFDGVLWSYACDNNRPDEVIVTHMDVVSTPSAAVSYTDDAGCYGRLPRALAGDYTKFLGQVRPDLVQFNGPMRFLKWLEDRAGAPVVGCFRGPTAQNYESLVERNDGDEE